MAKAKSKVTSDIIRGLLNDKYHDPAQHLIAFEVADGTGSAANRWADAVSMEMWPSKGYAITGYEIKVSRSDWLSELKQPDKSQAISQFCDHWYLVAPDGVLGIDELPKGWGWIKATERSLHTKIKAPKRDCSPPDKAFMASLLRKSIAKYSDKKLIAQMYKKARASAIEDCKHINDFELDRAKRNAEQLEKAIVGFEKRSGIRIDQWNYKQTGEAIKALTLNTDREAVIENLERMMRNHMVLQGKFADAILALKEWPEVEI